MKTGCCIALVIGTLRNLNWFNAENKVLWLFCAHSRLNNPTLMLKIYIQDVINYTTNYVYSKVHGYFCNKMQVSETKIEARNKRKNPMIFSNGTEFIQNNNKFTIINIYNVHNVFMSEMVTM